MATYLKIGGDMVYYLRSDQIVLGIVLDGAHLIVSFSNPDIEWVRLDGLPFGPPIETPPDKQAERKVKMSNADLSSTTWSGIAAQYGPPGGAMTQWPVPPNFTLRLNTPRTVRPAPTHAPELGIEFMLLNE
ncbi:hypothetical protein GT347_02890 [Xylophilus rhododendri]|uniref:Uncharacterized protein n=1 Tax=Xylophilus rhododendri TaxID=2697032 RepID=A0A857J1R1_9BURK|nr:hypothetical protein [Xylophilus rhododendri]QHI97021.1 hypothetical protein GT347_02890 [Xylophilus rhododendri]